MNIEEIDKWLDNEYGVSYTRLEELHDYFFEKYTDQKEEIERLNNIIKELKYGIKELDNMFYETFRINQNGYYSISEWELKEFTDKLQELKGDSSNE